MPLQGLLDFAFSPLFDTNELFYVSWTVNEPVSVYARFLFFVIYFSNSLQTVI